MQCSGLLCLRDSILGVPSSRVTHQTDMKKQCLFWDVLCSVIFPLQKLLLGNESSNRYLSSYCAVSCKDFSPFLSHFSSFKTCTVFSHCYYWHFCLAAMLGLVLEQKKCIGRYESSVSKGWCGKEQNVSALNYVWYRGIQVYLRRSMYIYIILNVFSSLRFSLHPRWVSCVAYLEQL